MIVGEQKLGWNAGYGVSSLGKIDPSSLAGQKSVGYSRVESQLSRATAGLETH
jgi:hypothetical protein